jgi:hypothetical protein
MTSDDVRAASSRASSSCKPAATLSLAGVAAMEPFVRERTGPVGNAVLKSRSNRESSVIPIRETLKTRTRWSPSMWTFPNIDRIDEVEQAIEEARGVGSTSTVSRNETNLHRADSGASHGDGLHDLPLPQVPDPDGVAVWVRADTASIDDAKEKPVI